MPFPKLAILWASCQRRTLLDYFFELISLTGLLNIVMFCIVVRTFRVLVMFLEIEHGSFLRTGCRLVSLMFLFGFLCRLHLSQLLFGFDTTIDVVHDNQNDTVCNHLKFEEGRSEKAWMRTVFCIIHKI